MARLLMTAILQRESGMPSLAGATKWLNSEPLTPADLEGPPGAALPATPAAFAAVTIRSSVSSGWETIAHTPLKPRTAP
jgi:hypothetical protein